MLDLSDVWALEGLQVTLQPEPAELSGLQFDLRLDIQQLAGEVSLNVEFNRRRFSEAAMQRFAKAYGDLLGSLSRQPDVALGSIRCSTRPHWHKRWRSARVVNRRSTVPPRSPRPCGTSSN